MLDGELILDGPCAPRAVRRPSPPTLEDLFRSPHAPTAVRCAPTTWRSWGGGARRAGLTPARPNRGAPPRPYQL